MASDMTLSPRGLEAPPTSATSGGTRGIQATPKTPPWKCARAPCRLERHHSLLCSLSLFLSKLLEKTAKKKVEISVAGETRRRDMARAKGLISRVD